MHAARLELLAQPEPLARARDVRELGGELAAVDLLQQRQDVLELHARVARAGQTARRELALQVGLVEPEEVEAQHGGRGPIPQTERIEIRDLMPAQAVDLDQPRDGRLLLDGRSGSAAAAAAAPVRAALPQALRYGLDDRPVRNLGAAGARACRSIGAIPAGRCPARRGTAHRAIRRRSRWLPAGATYRTDA